MSKNKTEKQINQSQKRRKRKSRLNHKLNHAEFIMSRERRLINRAIMKTAKPAKDKYKNAELGQLKEWR